MIYWILVDIKKKHSSHFVSSDVSIAKMAKAAAFFLSDGVIVTGNSTEKKLWLTKLKR